MKALFRRGKAHNGMGHTEEAMRDLQAAAKLGPTDRAISREIQALRAAMRHDREVTVPLLIGHQTCLYDYAVCIGGPESCILARDLDKEVGMQAQAKLFKGAFDSGDAKARGLWRDSTEQQQQQQRTSVLAWLWGLLNACLGIFAMGRIREVK